MRSILRKFSSSRERKTDLSKFDPKQVELFDRVRLFTMTNMERIAALQASVSYIFENRIAGAMVECGVWKGGSMMAVAYCLNELGESDRDLYLFDTFEGMSAPTDVDTDFNNTPAGALLAARSKDDSASVWCFSPIEEVKKNLLSTGYSARHLHFVEGMVEQTIPAAAPDTIALLRLDTDWYESTKHELMQLYPRLVKNGVLIIDDYGHWKGARKATDEFFSELGFRPYMHVIDYTARLIIKP